MKWHKLSIYFLLAFLNVGCKKQLPSGSSTSSINIINAVLNGPTITASFSDTLLPFYKNQTPIYFGSSMEWGIPSGAVPIIFVSSSDTTHPLYQEILNLLPGAIYSLFLTGQDQAHQAEPILVKDSVPLLTDSSAGLRIINLCPDCGPVTLNLAGNSPNQMEFSNTDFKSSTKFKIYSATNDIGGVYNFEIWNQNGTNLLTTFSWTYSIDKNNTLLIAGSTDPNSSTPVSAFQLNNY
jgi:hypothetical protein